MSYIHWRGKKFSLHEAGFTLLRALLLTILCAAMQAPRPAGADQGNANALPLTVFTIPSQSISQTFRTALPLCPPGAIPRGWAADVGVTWTNVWAQETDYLMDYETAQVHAGISRGFSPVWGMALVYDQRRFFSGGLDSLIQETHELLGIDQNHRDEYPRNRAIIELFDKATGASIDRFSPDRLNNSGLNLIVNGNLGRVGSLFSAVNLYGVARLPLESPEILDASGGFETGLGLGISRRWGKTLATTALLGYTAYRDTRYTGAACDTVSFENHQITAMAAAAWQVRPWISLQGQYLYTSPSIKGIQGLDKAAHEVRMGATCRLSRHHLLTIAFVENIITMDNSADFGLHLSLQQRF